MIDVVLKRVKKKYMNMFVLDQGLLKNTGIKDLRFAMFQELVLCLERNIYYFFVSKWRIQENHVVNRTFF